MFLIKPVVRGCLGLVLLSVLSSACDVDEKAAADPPARAAAVDSAALARLPPGATLAMVVEGEQLFGTACIACHGPAAAGTQLAPSLRDSSWIDIDGSYAAIDSLIHAGVAEPKQYPVPMPPLGGGRFSDAQVRALAAYVFTLSR